MLLLVLTHLLYQRCSLRGTGLLSVIPLPYVTACLLHGSMRPEANSYFQGVPPGRCIPFRQPLAQSTEAVSSLLSVAVKMCYASRQPSLRFGKHCGVLP
jgi:hypothetical protein